MKNALITLILLFPLSVGAAPDERVLEDAPIAMPSLTEALAAAPLPPAPTSIGELFGYDVEDAITAARVQLLLARNLGVDALRIEVLAQDDMVWLEGLVSRAGDREQAHLIAGETFGVAEVHSLLELDDSDWAATTPTVVLDEYILQSKLQLRLLIQLGVDAMDFWIDVDGDVVTLTGYTTDRDAAATAERLLRATPGVAALNDRVVLR